MSEYEHTGTLEPYEVRAGRELLVRDAETQEVYAGEWSRSTVAEGGDDQITLGYYDDPVRGSDEPARISVDSLFRHTLYTGLTGYGKSTALTGTMRQLAERGHGFAYFDPKGQDVLNLLKVLPEDRLDDVVWVEPGNENPDTTVGFNFFDTHRSPGEPGFENEVQEIVSDFVALLRQDGAWGATMDAVAKSVTTQLVRDQEADYTVLDMYAILSDEDEREKFIQKYGDEIEEVYLRRLAENYDDEEFDPLLRRIREWAEHRITREMVAQSDSDINLGDVVAEGKILLVRTSHIPSPEIMSLVATSIVRRIWATIRTRAYQHEDEYDPFFIVMDEFDIFATTAGLDIGELFSKGRSLQLGLMLGLQKLSQVPDDVEEAFANVHNKFAFNPGQNNVSGASKLAQTYNCGAQRLLDLKPYEFIGRLDARDGSLSEPLDITTLAVFPPLRSDDDVADLIDNSRQTYGASRLQKSFDFSEFGVRED